MRIVLALFLGLLCSSTSRSESITFDDLYSVPLYESPRISPDGMRIAFVLITSDTPPEHHVSHIQIMNSDGSGLRQLTNCQGSDWSPRWASGGDDIVFLSDRSGSDQVWRLSMDGGEAMQVTFISTGVDAMEVSPDGKRILFVSRVFPGCKDEGCSQARLEARDTAAVKARLYDHLLFRRHNKWYDGRVNRLFSVSLSNPRPLAIWSAPLDVPTAFLGGHVDFAMSPDGKEVSYVICVDSVPALSVNNDVYARTVGDSVATLISDSPGLDISPKYSPDGRYIAYLSMARAGYESDQRDIVVYDRRDRTRVNLTRDFDRSIGEFLWSPDGKHIYFTAIEHGFSKVWRLEVASRDISCLLGDAVYGSPRVSPDGRFLLVGRSLSDQPYELYKYDLGEKSLVRLTLLTDEITRDLTMKRAVDFWFIGALGDSVHGYLTYPPEFDSGRKYPLVLLIHGGPQWCWLGDFNYYGWNTQLVAAQGYIVVQIDPHGSVGYGQAFKEYVSGNWGKGDYEDLMKGVDYLIETCPFIDSTRLGALGRSYGGFMANWICGHTNRFKCLVSVDGTVDHRSGYGSTDELWFPEWEYNGTPWTNPDEYERSSPIAYAADFRTPMMIIHGQNDYRVDVSEGLQMFTALQRSGLPSQLLYFPDEDHSVHKLVNHRYVYEKQFEWLARWLAP